MGIVRRSFYVLPSAKSVGAAVVFLVACSGNAFEGNSSGSDLAGAAGDAGASSIGTAGASVSGAASSSGAGKGGAGAGGSSSSDAGEPAEGGSGGAQAMLVKCSRAGWSVSAFETLEGASGGPAELVLDGDDATRWTSGKPQAVGQWFQVDVEPGVRSIEIRSVMFAGDLPQKLGLVLDGKAVGTTVSKSEGVMRLTAAELEHAKQIRILVVDAGAGLAWWSIGELDGWCGG